MTVPEEGASSYADLRVTAHGAAIVEGTLRLIADGMLAAELEPPSGCVVTVDLVSTFNHGSISLLPPLQRQADGLFDWRAPIIHLSLGNIFPDLGELQDYSGNPARFHAEVTSGRFISVQARFPANGGKDAPNTYGNVRKLQASATKEGDCVRLQIAGPIEASNANDKSPSLTGAQLECDVLIPWAYLRAVGSRLAEVGGTGRYGRVGPWQPGSPGIAELALSGTLAFFDGRLELPGQRTDLYPNGPFVMARFDEHQMLLQGAADPQLREDGFVWPNRSGGGPELQLEIGHAHFARMLEDASEAAVKMIGPGIGHVNGQTGRVYESGGPCTQQVTAYRVALKRTAEGIYVDLMGELAPLPEDHWATSLGPEFSASLFIPNPYLFLRKWNIRDLAQERRTRFGLTFD